MIATINQPYTTPPSDRLVTGAELMEHPEWGPCELVKGKVIQVCRPNNQHGLLQVELAASLLGFVKEKKLGKVLTESGVYLEHDPDTVRGPDIFFIRAERIPAGMKPGYYDLGPDLCVEIVSPTDRWTDLEVKVNQYLESGVGLVWVINPQTRNAHIFRANRDPKVLRQDGILNGEEILPGFTLSLKDLFEVLE